VAERLTPKLRTFAPALHAFCLAGDIEGALEVGPSRKWVQYIMGWSFSHKTRIDKCVERYFEQFLPGPTWRLMPRLRRQGLKLPRRSTPCSWRRTARQVLADMSRHVIDKRFEASHLHGGRCVGGVGRWIVGEGVIVEWGVGVGEAVT